MRACHPGVKDDSGSRRCHAIAVGKKRLEACAIRAIREAQQLNAGSQEAVGVGSRGSHSPQEPESDQGGGRGSG